VPKLQFLEWPFEADSRSESIHLDLHVKMPNFTAEINTFTALGYSAVANFLLMTIIQEVSFFNDSPVIKA